MLFQATSIFSFIFAESLRLQFRKRFSILLPEGSNSKQPRLLPDRYNRSAKLLIFFLCFNVLLAGTNHVVSIELSDEIITKAHFQLYDCSYPQNKKSGIFQRYHNYKAPQVLLSDLLDTTQSCPECIDAHIQFEKSSAEIDFSPAILLTTLLPPSQDNTSQFLLAAGDSSALRQQHVTLSSYRLFTTRSTVLLI
jgi:hypothetical protein